MPSDAADAAAAGAGLAPVRAVAGPVLTLARPNIDTDQIVPARFLTTTGRDGLGAALFADWRDGPNPVDAAIAEGARVLLAGENFGCGSSREHAPWALLDAGLRAVVTPKAADIFKSNALKNGLVVAEIAPEAWRALVAAAGEARVDVAAGEVRRGEVAAAFTLDPFARECLLQGVDALGYLLDRLDAVKRFEAANHL